MSPQTINRAAAIFTCKLAKKSVNVQEKNEADLAVFKETFCCELKRNAQKMSHDIIPLCQK